MPIKLYYHPLSSFCWKVLIALYENEIAFEPQLVDLGDPDSRAGFVALWPIGKFPVLRDETRDALVPESSVIIEYLQQYHPGPVALLPQEPELARQARAQDRFIDLYVHLPMQQIVGDRIRPAGKNDPYGLEQAKARLTTACGMLEQQLTGEHWVMGEDFSIADCAAAPALYYADRVAPLRRSHPNLGAYLQRLEQRPSFARVLEEAQPYFKMFPG